MSENKEILEETKETASASANEETKEAAAPAVEETPADTTPDTAESMEDYSSELEASFRKIEEGDIITGTVINVTEEEVILDLKYFASGVIRVADMSNDPNFAVLEEVHEGNTISATVKKLDDGEGNILLSMKEAADELAWEKLKEMMDQETILHVKIGGIVNAGVIAYVEGIRGFIPASQLSLNYVEDLNEWLNKEVDVRIITVEKEGKRLVMSAKTVARERAVEETTRKIGMIVPGTIYEGTVESLMPYGAFVNIGDGLSGLVHISQISQKRIKKPSEVLNTGDTVKVKVLNTNDGKISLSMKALEEELETPKEEVFELPKSEKVTTNLGDLLSKFKL